MLAFRYAMLIIWTTGALLALTATHQPARSAGTIPQTDPIPTVEADKILYKSDESPTITVSGLWPNNCAPLPNAPDYNPNDSSMPMSMIINDGTPEPSVQVELSELLGDIGYIDARREGKAAAYYTEHCSGEPTAWSYKFTGNNIGYGWFGVYILLSWKTENPLNNDSRWDCDSDHYCYLNIKPNVFHRGEMLHIPYILLCPGDLSCLPTPAP